MAQDIADDPGRRSCLDLSCGVAVAKDVTAYYRSNDTHAACVQADSMAERTGGERAVGQRLGHEDFTRQGMAGASSMQVG